MARRSIPGLVAFLTAAAAIGQFTHLNRLFMAAGTRKSPVGQFTHLNRLFMAAGTRKSPGGAGLCRSQKKLRKLNRSRKGHRRIIRRRNMRAGRP